MHIIIPITQLDTATDNIQTKKTTEQKNLKFRNSNDYTLNTALSNF